MGFPLIDKSADYLGSRKRGNIEKNFREKPDISVHRIAGMPLSSAAARNFCRPVLF
jgi:hypothetical protein